MTRLKLPEIKLTRNRKIAIALVAVILVGPSMYAASISYEIYNDIDVVMMVYDNSGADGTYGELYFIDDPGLRIFTKVHITVNPSHTDGLAGFTIQLLNADKSRIVYSADMLTTVGTHYYADIDVNGYATGYYWIRAKGIAGQHPVDIDNPNYEEWEQDRLIAELEAKSTDEYIQWIEDYPAPDEFITEMKDDVNILGPVEQEVYIENPWENMEFTFSSSHPGPSEPVTFSFDVTTGDLREVVMTITDSSGQRVAETKDPNTFTFNEDSGQADDTYTARVFVTGTTGWVGGNAISTFTIDNPDPITGIAYVYIAADGGWERVLDGGTLKGDILVEVQILTGGPVTCKTILGGPMGTTSYDMQWDGTFWYVIIDSRTLVNGQYSMAVLATRDSDGASASLSVFEVGVIGGASGPLITILGIGFLIGMAFLVFRRLGGVQSTLEKVRRRL
jgi:general stress protein CsbA